MTDVKKEICTTKEESMRDPYKVEWLSKSLEEMKRDKYFIPTVRCVDGRYINLDEEAIKLLIDYYNKRTLERVVYVPDELNKNKYVLNECYEDFGIYEKVSPNGFRVSQDWLVYNGKIGFISQSYNNLCREELMNAIDKFKTTGKFGYHGFATSVDGIYGIHPSVTTYNF